MLRQVMWSRDLQVIGWDSTWLVKTGIFPHWAVKWSEVPDFILYHQGAHVCLLTFDLTEVCCQSAGSGSLWTWSRSAVSSLHETPLCLSVSCCSLIGWFWGLSVDQPFGRYQVLRPMDRHRSLPLGLGTPELVDILYLWATRWSGGLCPCFTGQGGAVRSPAVTDRTEMK